MTLVSYIQSNMFNLGTKSILPHLGIRKFAFDSGIML